MSNEGFAWLGLPLASSLDRLVDVLLVRLIRAVDGARGRWARALLAQRARRLCRRRRPPRRVARLEEERHAN